jgi:hypothetical protein
VVAPAAVEGDACRDPDDLSVLGAAAGADCIVSGDGDLLELGSLGHPDPQAAGALGANQRGLTAASILLISGCQANQLSADGEVKRLLTGELLRDVPLEVGADEVRAPQRTRIGSAVRAR